MKGVQLRAIFVAALMCATATFAYVVRPTAQLADRLGKPDLETLFPKQFKSWHIDARMSVVLPAPDVQARLDSIYNQVLTRTYINADGDRVMLSVAYGGDQSDGTRAHRPEVCYPAQGFQITYSGREALVAAGVSLKVRTLMSKLNSRDEPITYWMVVGDQVVATASEQKLAQIRYGINGIIPDGLLVRISTIDPDMRHGHGVQARFISDLAASIPSASRGRVFGGSSE